MSSAGQKVTSDQTKAEAVGVVTSDSLAADSLKESGSGHFGEGNPKAAASKQPSQSTNTNNTDTSNATKLAPAVDAEAREAQEGRSETSQLNAGSGLGKDAGVGRTYNTGSTAGSNTGSSGSSNTASGATFDASGGATAPTGGYAGAGIPSGALKPKGKNITEGGFDSDAPNASFTTDIGSKNDPGRVAEQAFANANARAGGASSGTRQGQTGAQGNTPYDALKGDEAA